MNRRLAKVEHRRDTRVGPGEMRRPLIARPGGDDGRNLLPSGAGPERQPLEQRLLELRLDRADAQKLAVQAALDAVVRFATVQQSGFPLVAP